MKFIPNVSSFVLERQENLHKSHAKKSAKIKCEHKMMVEDPAGGATATLKDRSNTQYQKGTLEEDYVPQNYERYFRSRDDVSLEFNTGRLLPEFPELRDSYDQFCTTMSEHSSRDDLDGKISNRGSAMSVLSDLKSTRGMRDSMYSSDESVHACKRRRKTNLEQMNADGKNHRWSMPEITKLLQQSCGSDPDYYDKYAALVNEEDRQSSSNEQLTQTCSTPVLKNTNLNRCLLEHSSSEAGTSAYPRTVKPTSALKERILLGESKSCPSLVLIELTTSDDIRDYDSSGFCDDSDDNSSSFSPMHSRTSVNTIKENPLWHGYKADLKDSGIYANEDEDSSASLSEIDVYASDSGFDGTSSGGARYSPEGEETNFAQLEGSHAVKLSQPKNTVEHEICERNQAYDLESKHHKAHSTEKQAMHGEKDKRCAKLMQEYIAKRTLDSYVPPSSFYRTSNV